MCLKHSNRESPFMWKKETVALQTATPLNYLMQLNTCGALPRYKNLQNWLNSLPRINVMFSFCKLLHGIKCVTWSNSGDIWRKNRKHRQVWRGMDTFLSGQPRLLRRLLLPVGKWEHLKSSFVACSVSRASVCPRMLIWRKCLLQKGKKAQRLSVVPGAASRAVFVPGQTKQALCAVHAGSSAPGCFPCIIILPAKFISCARAEGGVKHQQRTVCVNSEHLPLLIFLRFHLSFAGSAQELILCLFIYCTMGTGL